MAEDELLIHSGQLRLVDSLKKRVSQLFGVSVLLHPEGTRFFSDGGSASTRLLVSSVSGSQDDLEKAKKYLNAFFEEGPNFVKLSNIYSPESFAMVHERNSEIEKLTQVVLECQEESRCISMQGNEESIRAAKQIIEDLVKGKSQTLTSPAMWTHDIETDGGLCSSLQGGKFHLDSHNNNVVSTDGKLSPSSSCEALDACVRWQPRRESLHCEASLFPSGMDFGSGDGRINAIVDSRAWPSDAGDKLDCPGLDVDNGHYHSSPRTLSPSSSPSPPSPPSSSLQDSQKEVKEMRILQDQEHKVQKALKLGYSEEDAFMALERVGLDAGENDYLAELISLGSKSTNSMDSDRSPFLSGELELGGAFGVATSLSEKCELGDDGDNLRYIVIDGSNVAMSHGKKEVFSCRGIKLAVDWFRQRGHKQIKVFVPQWRKETSRPEAPITDQEILTQLEKEDVLVFTPARRIGSKRIVCYDDRYVLKLAAEVDGIVVSNDNYRDLLNASPDYRKVVEERLLMYSFVDDKFMPPDDPLGRKGPTLDNFLRIRPTVPEPLPPECPYGKKCTYGNKCRYYHPERGCLPHKSVTDKLAEQAKLKLQERSARLSEGLDKKGKKMKPKAPLTRTISCVPTQFMGNSASIVPSQGKEGISDADLLQRSQSLVEKRDYNEMLDEHRRKLNALERANAAEMKHFAPSRHMEFGQRSSTPIDPSRHSPTVLIQGPHPSAVPSQALDAQLLTPQMIPPPTLEKEGGVACLPSPSRSPPSSQLLTPTSQASERKGFFGGHLMLAKKLSDESQDSKFFDDSDKNQTSKEGEGIPRSSSAGVIGYLATTTAAPVSMSQAAVSAETLHQAMAQMSFPTRQHPSPRHSAPPTQHHAPSLYSPYSMDSYYGQGERCISSPVGQGQSQMDSMYSMRGFQGDHCQSFPLIERGLSQHAVLALQQQKRQGFIDGSQQQRQAQLMARQPGFQGTLYDDGLYGSEHLGLARLQSAPSHLYQTNTQPPPRPITRMARQNSSSDPQIHTVGMEEATDLGLLSRGTVPYTSSESNMASLDLFESSPSHPPGSQAHPNLHHQQQQHQHQQQQHQHQHQQQHHQQQHPHHSPHHQPPPAYNRSSSFHHGNFVPQSHYLAMSHQSSYTVPAQQHSHHAWQDSTGRYSVPDPWAVGGGLLSPHSVTSPNSPHMPLSPQSVGRPRQVQQFNADAEILPSDPRYNLYFHLCGLFPPAKVRMVMNQHPNETNAQELCSYIIGLK